MFLYCSTKQNATIWDATCANHKESGAAYCEDFALHGEIKADCAKYPSYLRMYCTVQAKHNTSGSDGTATCAADKHTKGMYCGQLALLRHDYEPCWAVASFDVAYCNKITWPDARCEAVAAPGALSITPPMKMPAGYVAPAEDASGI